MFPLGMKQYEATNSQYHFTLFYFWIQLIKPFTFKIILAIWRRKLHSFPHFHPNLLAPSFLWLPSICNCYTSILRWKNEKFMRMVTLNTLETIVIYTLISSILDRICEMTTKPLEYPRDLTLLDPLKNLLEIRTWGTKWKK
jgi:hypothetical protein